ncbi:formyl transferase [Ferruginibacter profundus]
MKIVMWMDGQSNQKALANKMAARFGVSGIIIEKRKGQRKITIKKIYEKIIDKLFLPQITNAWFGMLGQYEKQYKEYPAASIIEVENINSDAAYNFTKEIDPDIIIVSGTRLVKEKLLGLSPSIGILNLHTGLSPYIKGGPNCTNWCIATNQLPMIGNTIMWIDKGIDTGNIITTETTQFNGTESLLEVHIKVMEHGHNLYVRAVEKLIEGKRPNVRQGDIAAGTTYYTRQWTLKERFNLQNNFKQFNKMVNSEDYKKAQAALKTVPL